MSLLSSALSSVPRIMPGTVWALRQRTEAVASPLLETLPGMGIPRPMGRMRCEESLQERKSSQSVSLSRDGRKEVASQVASVSHLVSQ